MGGRSGQNIKSNLSSFTKNYAESIGLSESDYQITMVTMDGNVAGGVTFEQQGTSNIYKMRKDVKIDSSLSLKDTQKTIRHELTHIKQSKDNRFYIDGSSGKKGGMYWEGKKYMSLSNYNKIMIDINSKSPSRRARAFSKYENLPWEKEAFDAE